MTPYARWREAARSLQAAYERWCAAMNPDERREAYESYERGLLEEEVAAGEMRLGLPNA